MEGWKADYIQTTCKEYKKGGFWLMWISFLFFFLFSFVNTVTQYHIPGSLKQQKLLLSQFWRLDVSFRGTKRESHSVYCSPWWERELKVKVAQFCPHVKVTQLCRSLWSHGLYSPWNFPGQNTGVGSVSLSRGSPQPRGPTQIFHIAGGLFPNWATTEAQECWSG